MTAKNIPLYKFWQPRYWPTWLILGVFRIVVWLPQPVRMACGRFLGRLTWRFVAKRRHIATRNLELCFPELDKSAIETLTRRHFESLGMGVIELGMAWWCSDRELQRLISLEGAEHLQSALDQGKGVVMLSGHFATGELIGRMVAPLVPPMAAMYRPSGNRMNDQIMRRCRSRTATELITKDSVRRLLKVLKGNHPIWYAADQAYNRSGSELVPFFGELAATNTAISQIAKISRAAIVPFAPMRIENGKRYVGTFLPRFENFPSGDNAADAIRVNQFLEEYIRKMPEQYYWVHRRFKNRPNDGSDPYA